MALLKTIVLPSGLEIIDAYHKIYDIKLSNLDAIDVRFKIAIFVSQQTKLENKQSVKEIEEIVGPNAVNNFFSFDIMDQSNSNILRKCYDYLKTQTNVDGIDYTVGVSDI